MRSWRIERVVGLLVAGALTVAAGCGGDDAPPPDARAVDARVADARTGADAGEGADAAVAPVDAAPMLADASPSPTDAASADAAPCPRKTYGAYSGAEGPNCGIDGGFTAECMPGDVCEDADAALCRVVNSGLDGIVCNEPYDAYSGAGGPNCGSDDGFTAECKRGDVCLDADTRTCDVVASDGSVSACGATAYDAFSGAEGPNCGTDGGFTAECFPGDRCVDSTTNACVFVHFPTGEDCDDEPYDAYSGADGPNCGTDGGFTAECKPGDVCEDPDARRCGVVASEGGVSGCPGPAYDAYSRAGGPNCGTDGGFTAECLRGDVCESAELGTCRFTNYHDSSCDLPYGAYSGAGGPNCGSDGGFTGECEPGDACTDAEAGICD